MKKIKLENIVDIYNGSTPSTTDVENFGGEIPWVTPKDLADQQKKYISRGERNITEKGLASIGNCLLPTGTILLTSRAPIGLIALSSNPISTNQGFKNIVCDSEKIHNEYLFYKLQTLIPFLQNSGTGTTFKELSKSTLEKISFSIHTSTKTQQEIAKVLYDLDAKIALNNRINEVLEAKAKLLYDYWFVQFEFPTPAGSSSGIEGKPYKSSGGKMVYNKKLKREIPEGWEVKRLEEIANITMGQSPSGKSYNEYGDGMIFFQGSTDFNWRFPTNRVFTTEPSRLAFEDDILISVRAPVGTMNIAMEDCCIGRGLAAINEKSGNNSFLIYQMNYFQKIFQALNSVGTTFGSLTKDQLFNLELVYPPTEILKSFETKVSILDEKIKVNSKQNQHLASLRDWLLPMLMNGQVGVERAYEIVDGEMGMVAEPGES